MIEQKCIWNSGTSCSGEVSTRKLFMDQIQIPICESHFQECEKLSKELPKILLDIETNST